MTDTKPALSSSTIKAALALILVTVWKPLVMAAAALLLVVGVEVDTSAWLPFADDGAISTGELLAIVRDVALPLLGLLIIKGRKKATAKVEGWIKPSQF